MDEAAGLPVAEATQLLRTGKRVILATTLDGGWAKFRHDRSDRSAWAHEGPTGMAQLRIIKHKWDYFMIYNDTYIYIIIIK